MRKIFTSKKAIIAQALLVMAFAISGVDVIYGATTSTSSTDYINIKLTTSGSTAATMGSLSESTYVSTNNTAGSQTGTILLDNTTVVGHMHVNIGQTIDMYAPSADVDYTDKIGFSGNYTFTALGGKAGDITAKDNWAGQQSATGGYGSAITNSQIDYATGQSITYRKGSNGANVTAAQATNTAYWNHGTGTDTLGSYLQYYNAGIYGEAAGYKSWSVYSQVGTASYIQVNSNQYIVAGAGAPGVVMFHCNNYGSTYYVTKSDGLHADYSPALPSGYDGFADPLSTVMTRHYSDITGYNINTGRIVGTSVKTGVPVSRANGAYASSGYKAYTDMLCGWLTTPTMSNFTTSEVYAGYSGLATRSGSVFSTQGLSDSTYSVSVNSSITASTPYVKLKCNAKYITINNPTRAGYKFNGWTCGSGISIVSSTTAATKFKVTTSGATITANWLENTYNIVYNGNNTTITPNNIYGDAITTEPTGSTANTVVTFDKDAVISSCGYTRTGYKFKEWNTKADGTGTAYNASQTVTKPNFVTTPGSNYILYAIWEPIRYKVQFNSNDDYIGDWNSTDSYKWEEQGNQDIRFDQYITLTENKFSRTAPITLSNGVKVTGGYTYFGWSNNSSAKTAKYSNKQSVRNVNGVTTDGAVTDLYALWKKDITLTVDANGGDLSGITASESQTKTIYNSEYTATFDIVKYYNIYDANGVGYTNIKTDSSGITYRYLGLNTKSTDDEPKLEYDNYNSNHQLTTDVYDNTTLYAVWEPVLELSASLGRAQDASDKTGISTAVTEAPLMTVRMMTSEQVRYVVSKKGYCDKITVDVDENLTEVYRLADTIESFAKYSDNLNDSYFSAGRSLDNVINVGKTAMVYSQRGKFFIPIYCIEYQQYKIPQTNVRQFEVEFTADNSKSYYWKNYKGKHEIAKTKYIISVENVVDPDETEQIHKDLKYQLRLGN